ncbi:leucine-rich repeat-containing protein 71 isoform X1 [Mycteria americana]|uniref:leucine-rich repeat-containing protein 71 isoform X1 n=1 Tax=Mycteria americana TaxID=33587 RepID=UPI003F58B724
MRRRGERAPREKAAVEEEMKSAGRKAEQAAEQYQCTGLLEQDFPELCARAGIAGVPKVTLRPAPSFPADEEPAEPALTEVLARIERKYSYFQPCIQVEREHEDPPSVRAVFLRGWKVEEDVLGVLSQCLPALAGLQAVHLWKVGLTERLLPALAALPARCPCLRTLSLEGNPLPEPAFHTLMGSESALAHLSLRNNGIGDADARLIGQSLSSSNRSLVSLVLSFNRISDLGAGYIAQGLRLNRSLLSLSLANNDIGDAGAVGLAEVGAPRLLGSGVCGWGRTLPRARPRCPPGPGAVRADARRGGGAEAAALGGGAGTVPYDPKGDRGPERASLQPARQHGPRQAAPGQARQNPRQEEGAAAEGGGQAAQETAGAKSRPRWQRWETERPEPGGGRRWGGRGGDGVPDSGVPRSLRGPPGSRHRIRPSHRTRCWRRPGSTRAASSCRGTGRSSTST